MTRNLQRTPDGRIIEYGSDRSDHGGTHQDPRLQVLQPFFAASLAILPDRPLAGSARIGLLLFFLGAADRLWQRYALDDTRFPPFAEALLQRHGMAAPEAVTLVSALPQIREEAIARETLLAGAELLDEWLDSHDPNSILRLSELLMRWQDLPQPLAGRDHRSPPGG